ncbi:phosphoribosyltransferase [Candidatus Peregrinibacteria bacterium]|nr:phosphoribosyltransferase [Candidatus Peregrinibacteria bacterium]
MIFKDRFDAANKLAPLLEKYKGASDTLLAAIPRGAVEIGSVLSAKLNLPLTIVITKKIGAPGNPEYAIGAVAPDGEVILNPDAKGLISSEYLASEAKRLFEEIRKKYLIFAGSENPPDFANKTVIILDDGIATGSTVLAAIKYLKRAGSRKIVVAVPVAAEDSLKKIQAEADEVICLYAPDWFSAVGQFYENFRQVEDEEVKQYLSTV